MNITQPARPRGLRIAAVSLVGVTLMAATARGAGAQAGLAGAASMTGSPAMMGPGISRELAEFRSKHVRNVRYDLTLDVTARDTADGRVLIAFRHLGQGDVILDFRGPSIDEILANRRHVPMTASNGKHIRLPAAFLRTGENVVSITFRALIAPAGASIIRYHDATDGADYLYTLLVPSDANQLFPCFDQPDLKARTTLTLTIPSAWNAVANGVAQRSEGSGARTTIRFAPTKPMSTYLIAFAAGPWARVTRNVDGRAITMYARASRAKEVESDSLIATNARAMKWYSEYFGVPFPWPKLDFVLAPAFPFGGMEHPGAIFYNENSFIFRERATRTQRISREATIYHEVAHQWFGDLVTMQWFDDLWLKEGFATYMAAKLRASLAPGSNAWETFYLQNKPAAYAVDRTDGTTPIWQELSNLDQAKSNYGAIVYNKAPGVIKQLNYLVGDAAFRRGLHNYLVRHAYANATWQDLLASVGNSAGQSLTRWGEAYILRPGMPVIEQHVTVENGLFESVALTQHPADTISGPGVWPVRTEVLVRYPDEREDYLLMDVKSDSTVARFATRRPAPAYVFANAGDNAYALVVPDSASARWLVDSIGAIHDPLTRAMSWDVLWELVRRRSISPGAFIAIAERELAHEHDEQIVAAQLRHVTRAAESYLSSADAAVVLPALEATLRDVAGDTTRSYEIRKPNLDALIRVTRTQSGLAYLDHLLDSATAAGAPLRAPTKWAIITQLIAGRYPTASARFEAEHRADSTSEGRRYSFIARAATPDSAVKREYFNRYLSDPTLNEEWATSSLGAFNEPGQQALTIDYLKPALDTLPWLQRNRRIFFIGSWLGGFIGGQSTPQAAAVVRQFLRMNPALGTDLRQKVLQTLDELDATVAVRAAAAGASPASAAQVRVGAIRGAVLLPEQ
ncbi:MAG: M1 family aminopeptidase [Gemmatimonadota bacterium]|nr:M1 family aminopeptidase [Gemmatimonadota bacterium]